MLFDTTTTATTPIKRERGNSVTKQRDRERTIASPPTNREIERARQRERESVQDVCVLNARLSHLTAHISLYLYLINVSPLWHISRWSSFTSLTSIKRLSPLRSLTSHLGRLSHLSSLTSKNVSPRVYLIPLTSLTSNFSHPSPPTSLTSNVYHMSRLSHLSLYL